MNSYLFFIRVTPDKKNQSYHLIKDAEIHVWVFETDIKRAQYKALSLLRNSEWIPEIKCGYFITKEQLPDLLDYEKDLYQKALRNENGIASVMYSSSDQQDNV